jgi:hypothetical protein
MVLIIIITASILVLTVAGVAISQQVVAQKTLQRNDALLAAQAGLDAALGDLRAAGTSTGAGITQELPCSIGTNGFVLTGYLDTNSSAAYTATVTYYTNADIPTSNYINSGAVTISCYQYANPSYPTSVPAYALVESTGQDQNTGAVAAPSRTIEEIYGFTDDNTNVPGGVIPDYNDSVDDLCMSASSSDADGTPQNGGNAYAEKCLTAGDEDQTWEYQANFTIVLSWTLSTSNAPAPLCLQSNVNNLTVQLATCLSSSSGTFYTQQWGIDDNGDFEPANSSGGPANGPVCLNQNYNPAAGQLNLASCTGGFTNAQTWQPTPQVGAGDAGANTNQFVNYDEFGNCMDVTGQNVSASYLIDYMCKQFPDGANWNGTTNPLDPMWNQRFSNLTVTYAGNSNYVELKTHVLPQNSGNVVYCLWSPDATSNNATVATQYGMANQGSSNAAWVTVQPCPTLGTGNTLATGSTGGYANDGFLWQVNTSTTYNVMDYWSACLNADTADQQAPASDDFSTLTVATCSNATATEEWNAPATSTPASETHVYEPTLSGN